MVNVLECVVEVEAAGAGFEGYGDGGGSFPYAGAVAVLEGVQGFCDGLDFLVFFE